MNTTKTEKILVAIAIAALAIKVEATLLKDKIVSKIQKTEAA